MAAPILPMDGYHYDDEVLVPKGWRPRKGAPHTFDVGGLSATLHRLHDNDEDTVAVPRFDRSIEIARAGAILIERSVRLIVCEGNYLLLTDDPWPALRRYFDRTALVRTDYEELVRRNRQRWVEFGLHRGHDPRQARRERSAQRSPRLRAGCRARTRTIRN